MHTLTQISYWAPGVFWRLPCKPSARRSGATISAVVLAVDQGCFMIQTAAEPRGMAKPKIEEPEKLPKANPKANPKGKKKK